MKSKQLLSKALYGAIFVTSSLFVAPSAQAQVKIGTNPTTIDPNSNLEVEAANNKKVIVHKSDGTVVFQNTPSGAVTDSIVTVDAAGNVKAISQAKLKMLLGQAGSGSMSTNTPQILTAGDPVDPDFTTIISDELGSIDLQFNRFAVKAAGTYTFTSTINVTIPGDPFLGQRANVDLYLQRWDGSNWINIARSQAEENASQQNIQTVSMTDAFPVGTLIRAIVVPCIGCIPGNPNYTLNTATFVGVKQF